jgi:hypothetical protein
MLVNNFYIYRHIRPDTNEVFYIGKGNNMDKRRSEYRRAYQLSGRTEFWGNIVSKNNGIFNVEIIWNCETEQEANVKEVEFIDLYGRRDLCKGTLVNLSNGGEGVRGVIFSKDVIAKRSGKNHYNYKGGLMDKYRQEKEIRKNKISVINTETKETFRTITDAANSIGIRVSNLSRYLNGTKTNKTAFCYYSDYLKNDFKVLQPPKENKGVWRKVIDIETGLVYDSIRKSLSATTYKEPTIRKMLDGRMVNKTNLRYA